MKPTRQIQLNFRPAVRPPEADDPSNDAEAEKEKFRSSLSAVELVDGGKVMFLGGDETVEAEPSIERLLRNGDDGYGGSNEPDHQSLRVRDFLKLADETPDEGRIGEIDIEGLCAAEEYLWVVGSHSAKRKQPKLKGDAADDLKRLAKVETDGNRFLLGRIPLVDGNLVKSAGDRTARQLKGSDGGESLITALRGDPHLGPFLQPFGPVPMIPGKDNGFDIEGFAVADSRVFIGLRGPVLRGWSLVLEIAVEENQAAGELRLKQFEGGQQIRKHFVNVHGLGLRELAVRGRDVFLLAGPTMVLDGPVRVYRWSGALDVTAGGNSMSDLRHAPKIDIPFGNESDHAEGMALIPQPSGSPTEAVLVYDSPSTDRLVGKTNVRADVFKLP